MIVRIERNKDKPYLQVSKNTIKDLMHKPKLLGFHIYLLSKPDDWQFYVKSIAKEMKINKDTVCAYLKILKDMGYCVMTMNRDAGKINGYNYIVYEEKPDPKKPDTVESDTADGDSTHKRTPEIKEHNNGTAKNILLYLNEKAKRNYKPTPDSLEFIEARLKKGATEDECKLVIRYMIWKAKNDKSFDWSKYLDYVTPFRPKNFPRYLEEAQRTFEKKLATEPKLYKQAKPDAAEKAEVAGMFDGLKDKRLKTPVV